MKDETSSLSTVINNDPKNINLFDTHSLTSFAFCCGHFQFAGVTGHPSSPLSPRYLHTKHIPASGKGCCTGSGTRVDHVSWRSADEKVSTQRTHKPVSVTTFGHNCASNIVLGVAPSTLPLQNNPTYGKTELHSWLFQSDLKWLFCDPVKMKCTEPRTWHAGKNYDILSF